MNTGTRLTKQGRFSSLSTLSEVVSAYQELFDFREAGENHGVDTHDPVLDWCREASSIRKCIKRAVEGRRRDGKMFSEGSCIRESSKENLEINLLHYSVLPALLYAQTFEDVYNKVRSSAPWGIGDLTIYNVANRIAAYLEIKPEAYLYIHAGPLKGWKALMGRSWKGTNGETFRVPWEAVPEPLRVLPPHRVEDFLCEMRDVLHPGLLEPKREVLEGTSESSWEEAS